MASSTTTTPKDLFTIPIKPLGPHPAGSIQCTQPSPSVYLLSFSCKPDNRLTPAFISAFMEALDVIELNPSYPPGVVMTTSSLTKFYSNGLDLQLAMKTPGFFLSVLYPLWRRLLTYPMPTLALINGHAFAGGLMTAMMHDYRVFTDGEEEGKKPRRAHLCVNELEFGAPLPPPMAGIFRLKLRDPATYRDMVLEAKRFDSGSAVEAGIVDKIGGLDEALRLVEERGLLRKAAKSQSYGWLKAEMYREVVALLDGEGGPQPDMRVLMADATRRKEEGGRWFKEWQEKNEADKAKL